MINIIGFSIVLLVRAALCVWSILLARDSHWLAALIALFVTSTVSWKNDGKWIDAKGTEKNPGATQ